MGFWQCQVAIVWVASQKRGETKLRDFLLYHGRTGEMFRILFEYRIENCTYEKYILSILIV
jgi:hypothetical protein